MRIIKANSVNEALFSGAQHMAVFGVPEDSRNGPVIVSPSPVITEYLKPANRVLLCRLRDANPFFHLFEALWMIAGRNDLLFPQTFVNTFGQFSDDGDTLHGAYGYRWRNWFGYDQLELLITTLRGDTKTRRAVLSMWDGTDHTTGLDVNVGSDLHTAIAGGKDVPCNTHAYFDTLGGKLNMTVCCRSNDMILGAYGANAVHFSVLLEYMAAAVGLPMGVYRQFSNNFHVYTELYDKIISGPNGLNKLADAAISEDPYGEAGPLRMKTYDPQRMYPLPLISGEETAQDFHRDCVTFCDVVTEHDEVTEYGTTFFNHVVYPMYVAWRAWKRGDYDGARHETLHIRADDWRTAAQLWLKIREDNRKEKAQ